MYSSDIIVLVVAFIAGLTLGAIYFFALWKTVCLLPEAVNPTRLLISSFLLRVAVALAVFCLVMRGEHWERLAAALLGFLVMRKIITSSLGPQRAAKAVH